MSGRRPYARTWLNALKAKVKVRGLDAINKRTLAVRSLLRWRAALVADLGGEDSLSAQQKALVDVVTRMRSAWSMWTGACSPCPP